MFTPQDTPASRNGAGADSTGMLQQLEDYWQSLRQARRLPARTDLAPHRIDAVLPCLFILHRVAPGVARIRVAGQRIHDLLRMDARGMPFSVMFTPASHDRIADLVETAFGTPAIVATGLISPAQILRAPLHADMIMLPLADDHGATSRILGAIVPHGTVGHRPRRFDLSPETSVRIAPVDIAKPVTARPALRLVVNNR